MRLPDVNDRQIAIARVASLGRSGESAEPAGPDSPLATEQHRELLEAVNSALALILINAQALDGKLPPYSRSKRYIHEIERSAQRGGALLKRLLGRVSGEVSGGEAIDLCQSRLVEAVPPVDERTVVVANQGPSVAGDGVVTLMPSSVAHAAPVFSRRVPDAHRAV